MRYEDVYNFFLCIIGWILLFDVLWYVVFGDLNVLLKLLIWIFGKNMEMRVYIL